MAPQLLAEAKLRDEPLVPSRLCPAEVAQQPAALSYQHDEAALGVVVFAICPHVLSELLYPLREQCHLYIRGTGVRRVDAITRRYLSGLFLCQHPMRGFPSPLLQVVQGGV